MQSQGQYGVEGDDVEIWAGVVGASAGTGVSIALDSGYAIADICEYSGLLTSDFLDKIANTRGSNANPLTGTTGATTQADELWIGATATMNSVVSDTQSTPLNSFDLLDGAAFSVMSLAYLEKIVSGTGAANSGTTATASLRWVGCIATFFAAAAATTSTSTSTTSTSTSTSTTSTSTSTSTSTTTFPPCLRDLCLEVDGFVNVDADWDTTGVSPWIDGWNPINAYVDTNVPNEIMAEFTYEDALGAGVPRHVDVAVWVKADSAGNDEAQIDVYDGSGWAKAGDVTGLTTTYAKFTFDVSAFLNTWAKVNAAKSRFTYIEK